MTNVEVLKERRTRPQQPATRTGATNSRSHDRVAADLQIALIVELDADGAFLMRELQRLRYTVRHFWPVPAQIPENFDVVYCTLVEDLPRRIPWLPGEPATALVLVDKGRDALNLKLIHNCAAHGLIHFPATARSTISSLTMAREHFLYEQRLRGRIEKLDESLRTVRTVERAKSIVMQVKRVSEEEAFNHLRNQAMERRVTIGAVANAIIDSHELLG
ncbi:response regulator ANTAR domain-containing protein (plasmid) [Rhizobium etli 8C-3]|uniref:Response regulator ANTAR domain-containing protein n=2 Tax=Rhizobium etli TaxID=29449 RepID=A0A1L5PAT3_RHIET|nr:response regulator ANTAR domain-containing protein [Rhizobium etli 8C-3]